MNNTLRRVGFLGTGSFLPDRVVTNHDMEKMVETSDEWIVSRTGIRERRFAAPGQTTADLSEQAALKALEAAGLGPEDIDLIIVATVTPDMPFPATACLLQDRIGATKAAAFDLEAACSGFLYGVTVGSQMIATGLYEHVLVVGAETLSTAIDFNDRNTCVLFGDGAGAAVLGPVEEGGILATELGSDGAGGKFLYLPAGGSKYPASHETVDNRDHYIKMQGKEVFKFAVRTMSSASARVIEKAGFDLEDIDYLVPHQANERIIASAAKRLKLDLSQVKRNLDRYGNMSAASIPVALDEAIREGQLKRGDNVVLVGFGGGLTWGAMVMTY